MSYFKNAVIRKQNPHWAINYLKRHTIDRDVVDIILGGDCVSALQELTRIPTVMDKYGSIVTPLLDAHYSKDTLNKAVKRIARLEKAITKLKESAYDTNK